MTEAQKLEMIVSWVANEWNDGVYQAYCSDEELEAGAHYDAARTDLEISPDFLAEAFAEFKEIDR